MNNKQKLAEAEKRYREASGELLRLRDEKGAAIKAATDPLRERIAGLERSIEAEFAPKLQEAAKRRASARSEVDQLKVEVATAEKAGEVGKRYVQWTRNKYDYSGPLHRRNKTGVIQVWTSASEYPDNVPHWSRPHPGDLYLRLLNKDSSESKRFEKSWQWNWYPEGVNPNERDER